LPWFQEALEVFCRLKKALKKVTMRDLVEAGIDSAKRERLLKEGLLKDNGGELELTKAGEGALLEHREDYLHGRLIHNDGSSLPEDVPHHWTSCHHIDKATLNEFYERLKSMPYRIEDLVPLVAVPPGKVAEVVLIVGGRGVVNRLCEMGLTPETRIKVSKRAPVGGPVMVSVRSTDVAIDRGIASKILVKIID